MRADKYEQQQIAEATGCCFTLTVFAKRLVLVAAVQTVRHGVAECVLWQTLATLALEGLGIAGDALVTACLIRAIGTLPTTIADGGPRQASAVIALEGLLRTAVRRALLLVTPILAVLVLVAHEVPRDALPTSTLPLSERKHN